MLSFRDLQGLFGRELLQSFPERTLADMSALELREAMKGIPGAENLTVSYNLETGNQVIHCGGKTVEVGPMASYDEIRAALSNPFIPTRNTKVGISGYEPGSIKARLDKLRNDSKARRDAALGKLDDAHKKHEAVSEQIEFVAQQIEKEANDAAAEFAQFTNEPLTKG